MESWQIAAARRERAELEFGEACDYAREHYDRLKAIQIEAEKAGTFPRHTSDCALVFKRHIPAGMSAHSVAYEINNMIVNEFNRPTGVCGCVQGVK